MAKTKNTAIFSVTFSSHPFEKKMQAEKMGSSSPSLQGVKIQSQVDPFGPAFVSPKKKMPLIHQNDITSSDPELRPRTHPPKNYTTQAAGWGRKWTLGNAKSPKRTKKKCRSFAWWKNPLGLCFWVQKVGWTGVTYRYLHFFFQKKKHSKFEKKKKARQVPNPPS